VPGRAWEAQTSAGNPTIHREGEPAVVGEDRQTLASKLRRLAAWEIRDERDLLLWYEAAKEVNGWLRPPRSVSVPRELWRWLSDADLRHADPEYAKRQDAFIRKYIRELDEEGTGA